MNWTDFLAGVGTMLALMILCLVIFVVLVARPELSPSVLPEVDRAWLDKVRPIAEKVLDDTEARIVAEIPKVISLAERGAAQLLKDKASREFRDEFGQTLADREQLAPAPVPGPRWPATADPQQGA